MTRINGRRLPCSAHTKEEYSDRSPMNAVNNSGMSGVDGIFQTHSAEINAMWMTVRNPKECSITFTFSEIVQLGYMAVWNFNQPDYTGPGLRDVEIWTSCDGELWELLKGGGYPYRFARADGKSRQTATNLDDGNNSPVDFAGLSAKYVKLVPDERLGVGNWGEYIEHQHRYGLAQVRFYAYKPDVSAGCYLPARVKYPANAAMLTGGHGLSKFDDSEATHGNTKETMWISEISPFNPCLVFDLDGSYPLGTMQLWNYNEPEQTKAGLRDIKIYYSIDARNWNELTGAGYPYRLKEAAGKPNEPASGVIDFGGMLARYVKLEPNGGGGHGTWGSYNGMENRCGLSKVQFFAAQGYCVEPAREYDGLLSRFEGWSGADGIFMAPIDGVERKRPDSSAKSIVVFSDTFVGSSDPVTYARRSYDIINNSTAAFEGIDPYKGMRFSFLDNKDKNGVPSSIIPNPADKRFFYWLQDCIVLNGKLYSFTDNIIEDLSGMEGFQFDLIGVDRISFDISSDGLILDSLSIVPTTLYTPAMYFGCAVLPNHDAGGLAGADGYVYVYGIYEEKSESKLRNGKQLVVARVKAEDFEDFSKFTFFDGGGWNNDINKSQPICPEAGSEMSVSPIESGEHAGKYLFVYASQKYKDVICCRVGETPWGPVGEAELMYAIDTPEEFSSRGEQKVYYYNAKGHYHISQPGELLITNNVNTMDFESNLKNSDIYRPRFVRLHKI